MRYTAGRGCRRARAGFVLLTAALTAVMLLGMLGLCLDLSRMYVAKNELQAFVDAASIAATFELDGTAQGITSARNRAKGDPNRWGFQNSTAQDITVLFSDSFNGAYESNPANPLNISFVRVTARGNMVLYFMPGFSTLSNSPSPEEPPPSPPLAMLWLAGIARHQSIQATATSGQATVTSLDRGLVPYSPDAITPEDPNFGYLPGQMYTLRWPPPGMRKNAKNWCDGDEAVGFTSPSPEAQRGFIDIGDPAGMGSDFIRQAIVSDAQTHPLAIGDTIVGAAGNRGTESDALRERYGQDTDTQSNTYAEYMTSGEGNGRRLVIVPVNDPATNVVLGFAAFFLHPNICKSEVGGQGGGGGVGGGQNDVAPCCAEYVGSALVPGRRGAGSTPGAFRVRLFQ